MGMIQPLFGGTAFGAIASVGLLVSPSLRGIQPEKLMAHKTHAPAAGANPYTKNHAQEVLEIPERELIPTVDIIVHPDAQYGWSLAIRVENFAFSPDRGNGLSQFSKAHAHLYADGAKLTQHGSGYYPDELRQSSMM